MSASLPVPFTGGRRGRRLALLVGLVLLLELAVQPAANAASTTYVVVQSAPPLSLYRGGVAGLAATNPEALGQVRLNPTSPASAAYLNYLQTNRQTVVAAINAAIGRQITVKREFNYAIDGFTATLSATEAATARNVAGVTMVEPNQTFYTLTDAGPAWMNADKIWDGSASAGVRSKGEGIVAGIIDTGVNIGHPSFADPGPVDGYVYANPRTRFYGTCAGAVVPAPNSGCNNKLIGLYDFTSAGVADDVGHGSHTASTVAGNVVDASLHAPTVSLGPTRISGVAPHANIISYKACMETALPVLGACPLDALVAAIDQATADVVDIVNFSIGGGSTNPWSDPMSMAFFGTHAAGVFVAASAGNDGPSPQTMGHPANSPWLMAVAASTHNRRPTVSLDATKSNGTAIHLEGMSVTAGVSSRPIIDAQAIGNDLCNPFDATQAAQIAGKIVVCTQGVIARVAKGQNVKDAGGAGMVLVAQAGYKASSIADTHVLPAVMISEYDGVTLRNWLAGSVSPTGSLSSVVMQTANVLGDRMAGFSSRGPDISVPDVIKPDVTAPGVAIWAAWLNDPNSPGDDFNIIQGTSMSSPHAAGAGLLIRALHPNWTPDQIKSALMSTAFTVPNGGKEVAPVLKEDYATQADPFDRGGGRIDIAAATKAGFTLNESVPNYLAANPALGGSPSSINIASLANSDCTPSCSWTRTLTSTASGSVSYSVAASGAAGFSLTVSPASFTLAAGGTQTITVTATNTGLKANKWQFGSLVFTPASGSYPPQHFPVAATLSGGPPPAPPCDIPETTVVASPSDATVPPPDDILAVTAAGLYPTLAGDPQPNLTFGLKVTSLGVNGALPPNHYWSIPFVPPGTPANTNYFVKLATDSTSKPTFTYGTTDQAANTFTEKGAPDYGTYSLADGTIHWILSASKILNPGTGDTITAISGEAGLAQPGTFTSSLKQTGTGSYTLTDCNGGGATPPPTPTPTGGPDTRPVLYLQGNLDEGCTGDGRADLLLCDGPFLQSNSTLDAGLAARWIAVGGSDVNGSADRNLYDPNWIWNLSQPTTLAGRMTVEWWGQCNLCVGPFATGQWTIRLFADGVNVLEQQATAAVATPLLPQRLTADVDVAQTTAETSFVLQIDPYFSDAEDPSLVLYDGTTGCGADLSAPCDSLVRVPVAGGSTPPPTASPTPTVAPTPTPAPADLVVSAMSASQQKPKAGDPVVISATVRNNGASTAAASKTEFRLADGTVLGLVDTPAIGAGGSATVTVGWDTHGQNGDYVVTATADRAAAVAEGNEGNNLANLNVSIRGNKVQNQSYEQPNSSGNAPESWQGQSTGAGTNTYNQNSTNSSNGTDSVSISGTGKSAVLYGVPTWTSAAFTVTPGELLTVGVDVKSVGLSSAPSVSLAYLGTAGQVLNTVKVLTAPLASSGFSTLTSQVTVPLNVTSARLVLTGFSPSDTRTAGTVTFDNVGVWSE